jgi:hypothetical protein
MIQYKAQILYKQYKVMKMKSCGAFKIFLRITKVVPDHWQLIEDFVSFDYAKDLCRSETEDAIDSLKDDLKTLETTTQESLRDEHELRNP